MSKSSILRRDEKGNLSALIETPNLTIRSVQEDDLEHMLKLQGNAAVMEFVGIGGARSVDRITKYHRWLIDLWKEKNPISGFMVFTKETKNFAGMACLEEVNNKDGSVKAGEAEVMLYFLPEFWGKGHGKELGKYFLESIRSMLESGEHITIGGKPLTKLVASAHPDNKPSIKLQKDLGFVEVSRGTRRVTGGEVPRIFFELDLEKEEPSASVRAEGGGAVVPLRHDARGGGGGGGGGDGR